MTENLLDLAKTLGQENLSSVSSSDILEKLDKLIEIQTNFFGLFYIFIVCLGAFFALYLVYKALNSFIR